MKPTAMLLSAFHLIEDAAPQDPASQRRHLNHIPPVLGKEPNEAKRAHVECSGLPFSKVPIEEALPPSEGRATQAYSREVMHARECHRTRQTTARRLIKHLPELCVVCGRWKVKCGGWNAKKKKRMDSRHSLVIHFPRDFHLRKGKLI